MWKYVAVAGAAKAFSANRATRGIYRRLGNVALDRIRVNASVPRPYLDRARRLVATCDRYKVLRAGDKVLELGTGWVHWEATVLRLFYDVDVTLFDVCDNRIFRTYRSWLSQLRTHLRHGWDAADERVERAVLLADRALRTESFEELYDVMGFTYRIDPNGSLEEFPRDRFSLVTSADVLEHVDAAVLPQYLEGVRTILRPGGYSVHQIDLVDHYYYFDTSCSPKNYYRYSDRTWRRGFESGVQYFNRVQCPEWRSLFARADFQAVEENLVSQPLGPLELAEPYRGLSRPDLECMQMLTVHRKPASAECTASAIRQKSVDGRV